MSDLINRLRGIIYYDIVNEVRKLAEKRTKETPA